MLFPALEPGRNRAPERQMRKPDPASEPFVAHCIELLCPLGPVRCRRMFGAVGLYVDGLFVAIVENETLYLKVSEAHRHAFEAAGCAQFHYAMKDGRIGRLNYWTAPEAALDSPLAMRPWAQRALEAACAAPRRASKDKP